jgi:hypothetical protein
MAVSRRHAPFCDLDPAGGVHGLLCVSRPIAREAVATSENGEPVDVTVDLAAKWADVAAPHFVRLITEPPHIDNRSVTFMPSGAARQLAAALVVAAGQAEELDGDVTRPRPER